MWSQIENLLQPIKLRFNAFWQPLADREKVLLAMLGIFLFWVLLYALLWQPVQQQQKQAQQQLLNAQNQWQWLNQQIPLWQRQGQEQNQAAISNRNQLMSKVQQSLRQLNLHKQISKVDLTSKGVKVVFKQADAPRLLQWLATLEQEGVVSQRAQISPLEGGVVEAQIEFSVSE